MNKKSRKKTVKKVIHNLPEIEIMYDDWRMVNGKYVGRYENDDYEITTKDFSISCSIKVIDGECWVSEIILYIGPDEFEISASDQEKIEKAIIKNILI